MRCICVDDEPLALRLMEDYISKVGFLEPVAFCKSALEANEIIQRERIDLVFLDIQMPGLTGVQFIKSLTAKPLFILVTAYEKFAIEGYSLDVVDYLLKPVELQRFLQAVNKARDLHQLRTGSASSNDASPDYIFLNIEYSLVKVHFADIVWVEGLRDYIKIHLTGNAKPLVVRMSVKAMEEKLPASAFLRIHKSYIVAIRHIQSIRRNSLFIENQELPIGEGYRTKIDEITGRNND